MKVTLITGFAGSGKSTYLNREIKPGHTFRIEHDVFVERNIKYDSDVRNAMRNIFTGYTESWNKEDIKLALKRQPELNKLWSAFWRAKYNNHIASILRKNDGDAVIECPYLDDGIEALKNIYGDDLHIVCIHSHDSRNRCKKRGWSEERIDMVHSMQCKMLTQYNHIIDEIVCNED